MYRLLRWARQGDKVVMSEREFVAYSLGLWLGLTVLAIAIL